MFRENSRLDTTKSLILSQKKNQFTKLLKNSHFDKKSIGSIKGFTVWSK